MHELGLLTSVVRAVERAADEAGSPDIKTVALRVGSLSGTVPEALHGSWSIAIAGTPLDGAELVIEDVPATVWCPSCAADHAIDEFYALTCPQCGTPTGQLTRGREFEVAWVEWEPHESQSSST